MVRQRFQEGVRGLMRWWLKTRRTFTVLTALTVVSMVLTVWIGGEYVLLPSFFSNSQQAVLTVFLPVPVVAALSLSLDSRLAAFETTAVRFVPARDAVLVLAVPVGCLFLAGAFWSATGVSVARNVAFLTGLMLMARPWARQAAVMIPITWIALVVFFSHRPYPDPDPWTVLPEPASATHATAAALLTLAAGLTVLLRARQELS
ncbi:hypothetical protein ACQEV4_04090 [Streptomyces shenzhenensis]|uniref:hypothetical protein n=1 Tax=Streptomyces shenzhenensis TaxID=943815 RepID=UPI003D94FA29